MRYLTVFTVLFLVEFAFAQVPNIVWEKSYGGSNLDEVGSILQTSDGGYIIAGESASSDNDVSTNNGLQDFWMVKIDANGNISWENSFGGSHVDKAHSIRETSDGGYVLAGESSSTDGDITNNQGNRDYWIIKVDANGSLLWQQSYGGSNWDSAKDIQQTTDGGYIVVGESESNDGDVTGSLGDMDFWVIKLDSLGNLTWENALGGTSWDSAESVQQTTDGGYIISGSSESDNGDLTLNHGDKDYWVVKLDSNGILLWQRSIGGTDWDTSHSIEQTTDGGYIVAGESKSDDGDVSGNHGKVPGQLSTEKHGSDRDYWIVKLDATGLITWEYLYGGSDWDAGESIQQTTDGGYIISGYSNSNDINVSGNNGNWDYWVLKINSTGAIEWEKSLGGSFHDFGVAARATNDGGYIIAGNSWSYDGDVSSNYGSDDIWVIKLEIVSGIEEYTPGKRKLIKIVNCLGQETEAKPNMPLFYIYDDGSVEQKILIDN